MQAVPERRYRYRWSCQILYVHYTEFMELQGRKRAVAEERRWAPSTFWISTAGRLNDFLPRARVPDSVGARDRAGGAGS